MLKSKEKNLITENVDLLETRLLMENNNGISLPAVLSIIAGFFTVSGVLWHLGYWSTFNFNYFEYADFTDLFKSSLYPFLDKIWIILGLLFSFFGMSYMNYMHNVGFKIINKNLNSEYYKKIKKQNFVTDAIICLSLIFSGMFIFFIKSRYQYVFLPILISLSLFLLILRFKILDNLIKNYNYRIVFILFIVIYPISNFFIGKKTATDIINGNRASIITNIKTDNEILNKHLLGKAFLGSSSNYHFVYISPNEIEIIDNNIIKYFALIRLHDYKNQSEKIINFKMEEVNLYEKTQKVDSIKENLMNDSNLKK